MVLKVARSRGDEWDSGRVASVFDGHGVVRVLEHAPGAVLLDELIPGSSLTALVVSGGDREAMGALAGVIRTMGQVSPPGGALPRAEGWGRAFDRYLDLGDPRLPREMILDARERYRHLCSTQRRVRLLHADLQHSNVLFDRERGWTAIDPKGVVAETEFEVGAALRNPPEVPDLYSSPEAVRERVEAIGEELGLDQGRVVEWAYAQAVISAIWVMEDEGTLDDDEPALLLAGAARALLGGS